MSKNASDNVSKMDLEFFMAAFMPLEELRIKNIYDELGRIGKKNSANKMLIEKLHYDILAGKIVFDVIGSDESEGEIWDLDPYRDSVCIKTGTHHKGGKAIILLRLMGDEAPSELAEQVFERYTHLFPIDRKHHNVGEYRERA